MIRLIQKIVKQDTLSGQGQKCHHSHWKIWLCRIWRWLSSLWLFACICIVIWLWLSDCKTMDFPLSETVVRHQSFNGKKSLVNSKTGEIIINNLWWSVETPPGDSITVYCADGKRGYVDIKNGNLVTKPIFDKAWRFSEGYAAVEINGKIMFINPQGLFAFPTMFIQATDDVVFKRGYCIIADDSGQKGVIDKTGKWVVQPQYHVIEMSLSPGWFSVYDESGRKEIILNDGGMPTCYPTSFNYKGDTIRVTTDSIHVYIRLK